MNNLAKEYHWHHEEILKMEADFIWHLLKTNNAVNAYQYRRSEILNKAK